MDVLNKTIFPSLRSAKLDRLLGDPGQLSSTGPRQERAL
jgi:hypothetical protein